MNEGRKKKEHHRKKKNNRIIKKRVTHGVSNVEKLLALIREQKNFAGKETKEVPGLKP